MANYNAGGNRRKSMAQHELDGTFRKDRHGAIRNPEPPEGRPEVPEPWGGVGQREWDRMLTRLERSNCLWQVDDAAIYQYCRLFEETQDIARQQERASATLEILEENVSDVAKDDLVQLFQQI